MTISRPSARVLLVDPAERILLFHCRMSPERPSDYCWVTPGGKVRPGESAAAAAARELREETGQSRSAGELGPVVACCAGEWDFDGKTYASHDSFYWVRTATTAVDEAAQEDLERSLIIEHRWWTVAELEASRERIFPIGLAGLLRTLLSEGVPSRPVPLPWRKD